MATTIPSSAPSSNRVKAHIFVCVLAYHLLVTNEYALRQQHDYRSWATVRDQLRSHHMFTIILPTRAGPTLRIRRPSNPEPVHSEIYALLDLDPDSLPIRRSWDSL